MSSPYSPRLRPEIWMKPFTPLMSTYAHWVLYAPTVTFVPRGTSTLAALVESLA